MYQEKFNMIRLLLYKHKINNIGDHRLLYLALNSSQNHLRLKGGWYKDTMDLAKPLGDPRKCCIAKF